MHEGWPHVTELAGCILCGADRLSLDEYNFFDDKMGCEFEALFMC